jgi:hypothetical protein
LFVCLFIFTCWCLLSGAIFIQYIMYRSYKRLEMAAESGSSVTESNKQCTSKKSLLLTWWNTLHCNMNHKNTTEFYFVLSLLIVLTKESCMSQLYKAFLEVWQCVDL